MLYTRLFASIYAAWRRLRLIFGGGFWRMEVAFNLKIEIKLSEKYNDPQTELFRRISATHQCG